MAIKFFGLEQFYWVGRSTENQEFLMVGLIIHFSKFVLKIPIFIGNCVDPDQMPHLLHLIRWINTVCQCPFYGSTGMTGFKDVDISLKYCLNSHFRPSCKC